MIRSRRLDGGPSAHTDGLRQALYDVYADFGVQRARIRAVTARREQLQDAADTAEQLSFEPHRDDQLRAESAVDVLNRPFGAGIVYPTAAYGRAVWRFVRVCSPAFLSCGSKGGAQVVCWPRI